MATESIPQAMFGARYEEGHNDLVLHKHLPVPKPGKDEVLLKVYATGVCHSDVRILQGVSFDSRTYIMGHEICGVPVELGEGLTELESQIKIGKLYSVDAVASCTHGIAASGGFALLNSTGLGLNGGYADYVVVKADQLVPVPKGVSIPEAAIASDAGVTAHHAVYHTAGIKPGTKFKVMIFGVGGLGHLAVQYAKHYGATVYVCDFKPAARMLAEELLGLSSNSDETEQRVFNLIELQAATTKGFTVDVTIDFVANTQTYQLALAALKGNGARFPETAKMVVVGVSTETIPVSGLDLIGSAIHLIGNSYGSRDDLKAALELFASGTVKGYVSAVGLHKVQDVIDELRSYKVTGRRVVMPDLGLLETYVFKD